MKNFFTKKRVLIMAAVLCVGVIGTGTTYAMLTSQSGTVENAFRVAVVETQIEEELDTGVVEAETYMKKIPVVKNTGESNCFIRARITISPLNAGVKLYAGEWTGADETSEFTANRCIFEGTENKFSSNGNWIYYNGYYYYKYAVAPEESTASLFDAVWLEESADITVYQEAVLAKSCAPEGTENAVSVEPEELEGLFAQVNKVEENVTND